MLHNRPVSERRGTSADVRGNSSRLRRLPCVCTLPSLQLLRECARNHAQDILKTGRHLVGRPELLRWGVEVWEHQIAVEAQPLLAKMGVTARHQLHLIQMAAIIRLAAFERGW